MLAQWQSLLGSKMGVCDPYHVGWTLWRTGGRTCPHPPEAMVPLCSGLLL